MRSKRKLKAKQPLYEQRYDKVILQHDNVWPCVAPPVKIYLKTLKWEVLPHPSYSPGIVLINKYLFRSMSWLSSTSILTKMPKNGSSLGVVFPTWNSNAARKMEKNSDKQWTIISGACFLLIF